MRRKGQTFIVHNRVKSIHRMAQTVQKLVPQARIAVAHGQMAGNELEDIMVAFVNRDIDVLVCTTIIESGLDIPNVNTIIINDAHQFGLSDLHQLRGRVGRSRIDRGGQHRSRPRRGAVDSAAGCQRSAGPQP